MDCVETRRIRRAVLYRKRAESGAAYKSEVYRKRIWQSVGSRMEAGEDPVAACKRCALEETGLAVEDPRCHGRLNFALPGRDLRCYVFVVDEFAGTIKETDKNLPYWVNSKKLPFGKMSVDCRVWLPIALDRGYFDYYGTCNEKGYVVKDTLRRQLPEEPFA